MPIIADELLNHYRVKDDVVSLQLAYWLKTNGIQFMVAQNTASLPRDEIHRRGISQISRR
jgi:hypothetical protein